MRIKHCRLGRECGMILQASDKPLKRQNEGGVDEENVWLKIIQS